MKYYTIILLAVICLFCRCSDQAESSDGGRDYPSMETFRSIDACMGNMNTDPQRSHQMLDSLVDARLMTKARCDYYHAIVFYSGESNPDTALVICDRLLGEGDFGDDRYLEEEICVLASNITSVSKRHLETLKYASRGIALCHGDERMRDDEATLMARVGVAQQSLGQTEQARTTYARALSLLKENNSFGDFIALISLQRKQAGLYSESKAYDKVIEICQDILDRVERFDQDPSFIGQRPETMQESSPATHEFADFYKHQMYAAIARAYRMKIEQGQSLDVKADRDSVSTYIDKWSRTTGSQSPGSLAASLRELQFLGRKAELTQALSLVDGLYRSDSLVSEYVDYLTLLAEDAASDHDFKSGYNYLQRAVVVSDSIRQQEIMRMLTEQMSINMVQESQLARQDAESQLERQKLFNIVLLVFLILFAIPASIIAFLVRKNRESEQIIEMTQHDLTESKEEIQELVQQLEEANAEKALNNAKALYERIKTVVDTRKLYLDPDLDIIKIADASFSSRSSVSSCINSLTGKTFRQWISEYRLNLFVQLLKDNPDEAIDDLVTRCGYKDQSTFRRQFKAIYGMTAGEYRKSLEEEKATLEEEMTTLEEDMTTK